MVVDIPDDDTPKQSEGMKEGATKLPGEPKEDPMETSAISKDVFGVDSNPVRKGVLDPKILLLTGDRTVEGFASTSPAAPTVYVPGWGITRESLLSRHAAV